MKKSINEVMPKREEGSVGDIYLSRTPEAGVKMKSIENYKLKMLITDLIWEFEIFE